jgi:hypothetical protein
MLTKPLTGKWHESEKRVWMLGAVSALEVRFSSVTPATCFTLVWMLGAVSALEVRFSSVTPATCFTLVWMLGAVSAQEV